MNYSLLLTRSVDFDDYALILYPAYPDEGSRPLLLSMIQSMWDRGEPDGYANHMTNHPLQRHAGAQGADRHGLRRPPGRQRLDRGRGADDRRAPAASGARRLPAPGRIRSSLTSTCGTLGDLSGPAANGNGMFVWDIGPKRGSWPAREYGTDPAPTTNTAPDDSYGVDPHDTVIRQTPETRDQIATFLQRPVDGGKIIDPCGPHPCYAAGWTGP